jgi:glycosyltransferase involved in cell wall biosynthesis
MNIANDLVSVVVPTYNSEKYIKRALDSILQQSFSNWEVIVVDNYSVDETKSIVLSYKDCRIKLLNNRNNGVIASSRNAGIKSSKGRWVAFLDSDDWWDPDKLRLSVNALKMGATVVYHNLYIIKKNKNFLRKKMNIRQVKKPVTEDLLINGNMLPNSSVVVDRKILYDIGLLNEDRNFITYEDYDAWLRISELTENFVYIPKCLGFYWEGESNLSSTQRSLFTKNVNPGYLKFIKNNSVQFDALIAYMDIKKLHIDKGIIDLDQVLVSLKISSFSLKFKTIFIYLSYIFRKSR